MSRSPRTRDCAIDGCTRAEHRHGMCRVHAALVPDSFGIKTAVECMLAQAAIKRRRDKLAQEIVRERL